MITDFSEPEGFLERWTSVKEEVWVSVVVFSSFIIKRPPISSPRIPDDQEVGKTRSYFPLTKETQDFHVLGSLNDLSGESFS